uniref:Hydroxylysine kinase n=1 Tax=Cacopsylla melanoneura TaxID=428564 RepID=A0A8D8W8I6_9HEMI
MERDSQHSCLVFDLAIAITYMVLQTGDLDTGGYVLAGYNKVRKVPYNELNVLQTCMMSRLCQSLVLGLYTYQEQGSNNPYVLGTQEAGWRLLDTLESYHTKDLIMKWTRIGRDLDSYDDQD